MTERRRIRYVRKDLLLGLALIVIVCVVVGTYEDLPQIVRQLLAGDIDWTEALGRIVGAMVRLARDLQADWRPVQKQVQEEIDQVQRVIEHWIRRAMALVR